jgi:serine protease
MNRYLTFATLAFTVGGLVTIAAVSSVDAPAARATDAVAATGSAYFPLTPVRVFDTRINGTPLGALGVRTFTIAGVDGVPADATAVILNVTVVDGTATSYLTVYPDGASQPGTSNLNWTAGQAATPNLVTVEVGRGGNVDFFNSHGSVDIVADLEGYFAGGTVPSTTTTVTTTGLPMTTTTTTSTSTSTTIAPASPSS